ncbi:MAG: carcinine hydrolase/isopenicillin-N N-acyltransferase family protein [Anaeromyxobacter sp.]
MALRVEERIVSGGGRSRDEVLVHHLSLRGTDRQIGRHLAELARGRYGVPPAPVEAPLEAGAWLISRAAALVERVRGAAGPGALLSRLGAPVKVGPGAAAFVPAALTTAGGPLLARVLEAPEGEGPLPLSSSRPYLLELHPDQGLPSLALVAFDLLGGVLDGINAAGLGVVAVPGEDPPGGRPPLDGLQLARVVLDGCRTAEEAGELLAAAPPGAACGRWIVADRGGAALAVERTASGATAHRPEAPDAPLLFTDCALRALRSALAAGVRGWTAAALDAAWALALAAVPGVRPLWRGVYDLEARALDVRFLAGDGRPGEMTPELRFALAA